MDCCLCPLTCSCITLAFSKNLQHVAPDADADASESTFWGDYAGRLAGSSGSVIHRHSIRGVLASTLRTEGFVGLYKGIGPTLFGILPYAGLKFYVYQSLKQHYRL